MFDPTLNMDSLLFPDPLLLEQSQHPEMRLARTRFEGYFESVMILLHGINAENDKVWRTAFKLLSFPEIKGTCLGFGASSISGSGTGPVMTRRLLETGRDVIRMGIDDPDLFMAMGLFEEDFGPDLIGDMITNIAFEEIASFNQRILDEINVPFRKFDIKLRNGKRYSVNFAENPTDETGTVPVILMPKDILRDLPVATCWREVQNVAAENDEFRESLNTSVAALWSKKTLESKERLRTWALSSPGAFGSLLDMLHGHDGKPYDFVGDPHGELIWRNIGDRIVKENPLTIQSPQFYDASATIEIVEKIIDQFKMVVEKRDLWRELYSDATCAKPRFEKSSQRLLYISALSYCHANNLDISPEAETGRGPVDFKFSTGINDRVLVELKLSTNNHTVKGFEKQLSIYNEAEAPIASYYVVVNVGNLGEKWDKLQKLQATQLLTTGNAPNLILIDGLPKRSASVS